MKALMAALHSFQLARLQRRSGRYVEVGERAIIRSSTYILEGRARLNIFKDPPFSILKLCHFGRLVYWLRSTEDLKTAATDAVTDPGLAGDTATGTNMSLPSFSTQAMTPIASGASLSGVRTALIGQARELPEKTAASMR